MGVNTKSVSVLVVLHIDAANKEIWLSGPIPGSIMSKIKISKTGKKKNIELDFSASNLTIAEIKPEETTQESAE